MAEDRERTPRHRRLSLEGLGIISRGVVSPVLLPLSSERVSVVDRDLRLPFSACYPGALSISPIHVSSRLTNPLYGKLLESGRLLRSPEEGIHFTSFKPLTICRSLCFGH